MLSELTRCLDCLHLRVVFLHPFNEHEDNARLHLSFGVNRPRGCLGVGQQESLSKYTRADGDECRRKLVLYKWS